MDKGSISNVSNLAAESDVIQELMDVIEYVSLFTYFRRTQRKECFNLVRRMKLLVPLLEEIYEFDEPVTNAVIRCLYDLKRALLLAKKLLKFCHDGSKIFLAFEGEAVMGRFRATYDKINQALEGMPYEELGISDEVREQVELMRTQLRRAKRRADTQDMELAMDMIVVFSKKEDRNADRAILERLAHKLELHSIADLKAETIAIRKLVKERAGQNPEGSQQLLDLLRKFKQVAGIEDESISNESSVPKTLEKSPSLIIPHEFLCPITLELMTDPVIVATGQTYERESIQKWLDSNHRTCPKTGQILVHLVLAPNYALRNLILNWCEKNNVELPKKEATGGSNNFAAHKEEISTLVQNLSSSQLDMQRRAVTKIRMLSKENPDNRVLIASSGGIPSLVRLLSYPDSKIQEHTVTALLNLSIDEANKRLIVREGAIPAIIEVLQNGTIEAKENSAAALFSLSILDENKTAIGNADGIPPLVDLLQNGTIRGKKDAATALFNLALNQANKVRVIKANIVPPLLQLLTDKNLGMIDESLSILLPLASLPEAQNAIGQLPFVETLVELIRDGTPKNKECAISVLLELGLHNSSFISTALEFGVNEHLIEISKNGTSRAQRKANSFLQLIE
ncbi:U-box domain-containing protein 15-like [Macadamia integrifolia]|uniref:U-box domain-containing protein 15-like n=1 Tax=Macadamia integrifolia TaxID=60698 RepID=UPI001C4E917B|nr:U-box domain-containing protein 15-like [Macadamia integrifolia]